MSMDAILTFLESHKKSRIALVSHPKPDGDALGSILGMAEAMRGAGFDAVAVNAFPINPKLEFLAAPGQLRRYERPDWHTEYDCLGVLDCGELDRLDELNREAARTLPLFNIDHHASSRGLGQASWIEADASSVGEMVVRLALAAGWPLTPAAAEGLWTAIVTDTGRFSFENTTTTALDAARECVKAGANPSRVAAHLYQSVLPAERQLQARVLSRMILQERGRLAISWLKRTDFQEAGIGGEGTQDMVNLLRDTAGVEVAAFLYEPPEPVAGAPASIKVSLRTASPHNALDVVTLFKGGGHERAAGCNVEAPMHEAIDMILKQTRMAFFNSDRV